MLPKISHPMFDVIIPSTKKKIKIRPMLVKEEKILLMAKNGEDSNEILSAVKQIVNNCIVTSDIDVDKLALFDIEYLFVKIRSISVSNIASVSYIDNEDGQVYSFDIDLSKVEVKFPEKIEKNIKITDSTGIIMKYPEAELYSDKEFLSVGSDEIIERLIIKCIDKIYENDTMYDTSNYKLEEVMEFLEQLDVNTFTKIKDFFNLLPKIYYKIEYKNSKETERVIELTALKDFFMLR